MTDARGQAFEEPDMRAWICQINVSQPLASDFGLCDFHAALVADHAPVLHAFVFSAQAFPIGNRPEDARAEQTIALRLECSVVDRLRLRHLTVRPLTNLFG